MIIFDEVSSVIAPTQAGDPAKVLLQNISLELAEQRIGIVGANGSGKSTLLKMCNGLCLPSQGVVSVQGFDTKSQGKEVRKRVGFIFTDPLAQLLMSTPSEDIELSLRTVLRGKDNRRRRAQELLDQRGIGKVAHQSIYDISGGERQLVALTSVLAVEPEIIVADEPTTLLDLRNRNQLREIFLHLPQQLIFSSHDLGFLSLAQRVIVLERGKVVADDEPTAAIDFYRRLME